jgi:tRNA(adenine34) deaminase
LAGTRSIALAAMKFAIEAAEQAPSDELPIGAAVVDLVSGQLLMSTSNLVLTRNDVAAHAELFLLRALGRTQTMNIGANVLLAVTLEPCPMCAWAIRRSGIKVVAFGARNEKFGAAGSVFDILRDARLGPSDIEIHTDVEADKCAALLREKFGEIRGNLL